MRLRRMGLPPALGLVLLSALWALGTLRTELFPRFGLVTVSHALGQAVLFFIFAVVAACIAVVRRVEFPRGRSAWACAGVGLGLFLLPAALLAWAQGELSTLDRVAVFSLTPFFAVVLEPYLQGSTPSRAKAALGASLTAITGVLFLFPLTIPGSLRAGTAFFALLTASFGIATANCVAVRLAVRVAERSILPMAALTGGVTAICFAAAAAFNPHAAWRWNKVSSSLLGLLVIDLPALFLLFWLMPRLAASRMTARFLVAPLMTLVLGMALEAPSVPVRAWLGTLLLAGGAGWLVFAPSERPELEGLELRNTLIADSPRRPPPAD